MIPLRKATSRTSPENLSSSSAVWGSLKTSWLNKRSFVSKLMSDLCQLLQAKHIRMEFYHSQTDGLVKQFNQMLKSVLWWVIKVEGGNWDLLSTRFQSSTATPCPKSMTWWSTWESPLHFHTGPEESILAGCPSPRHKPKTTFSTSDCHWQHHVLPFRLHRVPMGSWMSSYAYTDRFAAAYLDNVMMVLQYQASSLCASKASSSHYWQWGSEWVVWRNRARLAADDDCAGSLSSQRRREIIKGHVSAPGWADSASKLTLIAFCLVLADTGNSRNGNSHLLCRFEISHPWHPWESPRPLATATCNSESLQ